MITTITLTVSGVVRTAELHIPSQHDASGDAIPAIFGFHGGGGNGAQFSDKWVTSQDSGYLLVFPSAIVHGDKKRWIIPTDDYGLGYNVWEDVEFVDALIEHLEANYNVSDFHCSGFSSGAKMCWGLYSYRSEKFLSISPMANRRVDTLPTPVNTRPVFFGWGKNDDHGSNTPSTLQASAAWALSQFGLGFGSPHTQNLANSCTGKVMIRKYGLSCWFHFHKKGGHKWESCVKYKTSDKVLDFINACVY